MPLWLAEKPLVLASQSASRRAILRDAGLPVEVVPAGIDERGIERRSAGSSAGQVAALLAREKAQAIAATRAGRLVLGADQTLAVGERRFSKPVDRAAAREQLTALRGCTHELHTAITLVRDRTTLFEHCGVARLTMRPFSADFLERYLDLVSSSVTTSVGAYQVEKAGIQLFERIEGDHFVILGLPLLELLRYLRREGFLAA